MSDALDVRFGRRWGWLAATAVLAAGAAQAQAAHDISIDAGALEPALLSLARQTEQQIMFSKAVTVGRDAPAVRGAMTPEQALDRLLAGMDLRARRVNAGLIVVERAPAAGGPGGTESRPFVVAAAGAPATTAEVAPPERLTPTLVEEFTVTGSNIRGAKTASPLLVIDRDALARSGHATLAGALQTLPQVFGGGANEATFNTGADRVRRNVGYGASINLRGLGSDATLVLINGRRVAGSGSFGDFTDISGIPTAAVDRVEILLDGASAIYGADAVAGVVNIVLRKDYAGAETRTFAGVGTAGEPYQLQLSQTLGRLWRGGGVLLAYEYQEREALRDRDRAFTATTDLRPWGGTDRRVTTSFPGNILGVNPATGASGPLWGIPPGQDGVGLQPEDFQLGAVNRQNARQGADTLPRQRLHAAYLAAHQELGERLELTGDLRYSVREFATDLTPQTTTLTVNRSNPFFVSPNGSATHNISYAFAGEYPNPRSVGSTETWSATLGGRLRLFGDWRADGYLGWGQEITEQRTSNTFNTLFLSEALGLTADRPDTAYSAVRDGYFNPFNAIPGGGDQDALAFINSGFGTTRVRVRSAVASAQADGPLFELPGGPLELAVGAQARRESLFRGGSTWSSTINPVPLETGHIVRKSLAGFAELRAPLVGAANARPGLERLEVSLAGRVEHFDDVGSTATPKVGVLWSPIGGLAVRGTYGRAFRAPALREVQDRLIHTQSTFPLPTGERVRVMILQGGNPDLEPQTATSWTLGFDLRPARLPGLSLSATGFDIEFRNRIDRPVSQNPGGVFTDPTLSAFVRRVTPATNAADLAYINSLIDNPAFNPALGVFPATDYVAVIDNRYVNTATLRVRGVDVQGAYSFQIAENELTLGANATWMADYRQQVTPTSGVAERIGLPGFPVAFRGRATADWTRERLTLGAAVNYVDSYRDGLGGKIDSQTTLDLQARWAGAATGWVRDWDLLLNLRNAFDSAPPFYDNVSGVAYDPNNGDPIGRFVSLQLTRRW